MAQPIGNDGLITQAAVVYPLSFVSCRIEPRGVNRRIIFNQTAAANLNPPSRGLEGFDSFT